MMFIAMSKTANSARHEASLDAAIKEWGHPAAGSIAADENVYWPSNR